MGGAGRWALGTPSLLPSSHAPQNLTVLLPKLLQSISHTFLFDCLPPSYSRGLTVHLWESAPPATGGLRGGFCRDFLLCGVHRRWSRGRSSLGWPLPARALRLSLMPHSQRASRVGLRA